MSSVVIIKIDVYVLTCGSHVEVFGTVAQNIKIPQSTHYHIAFIFPQSVYLFCLLTLGGLDNVYT